MANVQPNRADYTGLEATLAKVSSALGEVFEDCFASVRAMRAAINAASGADAATQAFRADLARVFSSEIIASAKMDDVHLDAIRACLEGQDGPARKFAHSMNRPVTRLVGAMQSRDAIEQRIAHVYSAADIIVRDDTGKATCLNTIVMAQLTGIRETIESVAATCRENAIAVSDAAVKTQIGASTAFAARQVVANLAASGDRSTKSRDDYDTLLKHDLGGVDAFATLIGHAGDLDRSAGAFAPVVEHLKTCEDLISKCPHGDANDMSSQSERLVPIYTVDDERAIHKATLDRIRMAG